jgi:hypothetical protein
MAEDRLFQMDILRRAGKGRLAELIGDDPAIGGRSAADFDVFVRRELYTEPERQDMFARLPAADQASFRAWVDGVNLYIAEALADPLRKLPSEFVALGTLPAPWSVTDSIGFAALAIGIYGGEGGHEVENAALYLDLLDHFQGDSEEAKGVFDDLFWIEDPDAPVTIAEGVGIDPNRVERFAAPQMALLADPAVAAAIRNAARAQHDEQAMIDEVGRRLGLAGFFGPGHSNALVVSGAHTATGHPMLGGGPQVGYAAPSFFWESGLHTPGYDSVGVNVPLGPGNIMGRTSTLAYTVTSGIDDQIDTYVERLDPDDPHRYWFEDQWRRMECRTEVFLVRMQPPELPDRLADPPSLLGISVDDPLRPKPAVRPIVQDLCRTVHGPVFFVDAENHFAFSHKKAHWGKELDGAAAWLRLGAKTAVTGADSVEQELDGFAFTFNFHYASTSGEIGYFHRGRIPLRPDDTDPRLPLPGGGGYEWQGQGWVAASDLGSTKIDPTRGYIANWNNKPIAGWGGAGEARELWGPRHRVEGISREVDRLITAGMQINLDEGAVPLDGTSSPACFAQSNYAVGSDPLGCVTSVNGIIRKAATSDIHALTVLPFLEKAAQTVSPGATGAQAIALLRTWVDAGAPLLGPKGGRYPFPGVAIYREWRQQVNRRIFADDLGPAWNGLDYPPLIEGNMEDDHGSYLTPDSVLYHVLTHDPDGDLDGVAPPTALDPSRSYCQTVGAAPAPHACARALIDALADTVAALGARFGSDPATWLEPVIVSTVSPQGAAPEIQLDRMNRGSWNQLHDFGPGAAFLTFNVMPPGESGMIDLATLLEAQAAGDGEEQRAVIEAANPHFFDQAPLYEGWRYKPFVVDAQKLEGPVTVETVRYVRGVVPQPDTAVFRNLWNLAGRAGLPLPDFDLFGEIASR